MRKFLGICGLILVLGVLLYELYYGLSFVLVSKDDQVSAIATTHGKGIFIVDQYGNEPFTVMGVDLGAGMPGKFATEFAIPYETYLSWFALISDMNANVIRVYTIQDPTFYEAFHDFNQGREQPLYLLHGVWVDDDVMRSSNDAYDDAFLEVFKEDCRMLVDVLHGRRTIRENDRYAYGRYRHDVSPWVLGYILGVEWEQDIVLYTDDRREPEAQFQGAYLYTTPDASAFEGMLARVGDTLLAYESEKYGEQRLLAFSNWPETDPLEHQQWRLEQSTNLSHIDVEHIRQTDKVQSGMFASYHIYPYYPLFMDFEPQYASYVDETGTNNPYLGYLRAINDHHSIPVVVTEYGLPASRGVARINLARGMNQGGLSEADQAERLPILLDDIMNAGCAGAVLFEWHDEWFKRTWNTWPGVDLARSAYWSDYQTNEQFFGLLSFDPGTEQSVCYVDGDASEWADVPIAAESDALSVQVLYDEKFLYFHVRAEGFDPAADRLYLPIDLTDRSGAYGDAESGLAFDVAVDFLLVIDGTDNSRLLVQEYYDTLYATERAQIWGEDPYQNVPAKDSSSFRLIEQFLRGAIFLADGTSTEPWLFPTGELRHGNANPDDPDYDSLADYMFTENGVEIRIPYGLLNFADPSTMRIHDDYYEYFGIVYQEIDHLTLQAVWMAGESAATGTAFADVPLEGWYDDPTYHERLKPAYYTVQEAFERHTRREE